MKTLLLVRHAKSSWVEPGLSDIDRPLSKRGKNDAPNMGRFIREKEGEIDLLISSPAKRAKSTAKRMAKELGYKKKKIETSKLLYMADTEEFFDVIKKVPGSVNKLMLFSHNYGITYFANFISGSSIDNIPTCGVVRVDFDTALWSNIDEGKGQLVYFEYPKKLAGAA